MVHDGIILWAPVVFPPATLMPWCNPKFLPQDNKKAPNTPISVISCQVFVALDGWAGIRLPPKTGLLEKTAVAVVPPHSEFTITAASPMFAMHLGQVFLK